MPAVCLQVVPVTRLLKMKVQEQVQDESDTDQGSEQELTNLNKECEEQDVLDENQEFGDQEEFEEKSRI